jgi:hypothetical protein
MSNPKRGQISFILPQKSEIMNIADLVPQLLAKYILHKGVDNTALFSATPDKQIFSCAPFLLTLVTNHFWAAQT